MSFQIEIKNRPTKTPCFEAANRECSNVVSLGRVADLERSPCILPVRQREDALDTTADDTRFTMCGREAGPTC